MTKVSDMLPKSGLCLEKDLREVVKEMVEQLDQYDRTYFGKDRHKLIKNKIDEITALLDSKPIEFSNLA